MSDEQAQHPHGPPDTGRHWERGWLERSWEAASELLRCEECLPGLDSAQREKLRLRWLGETKHYDQLWRSHRAWYYRLRIPLIVAGATVTVLAGLGVGRLPTALVGLTVAVLTSMEELFKFGPRWQALRQTTQRLNQEGWWFIELTGPYLNQGAHKDVYQRFLDQIEAINAGQSESYLGLFGGQPRSGINVETDTSGAGGSASASEKPA